MDNTIGQKSDLPDLLKSYGGKSLRILASRKGIKYYASYSTVDLIKMLTPLVNTSDFPIMAKRKLAPVIETKKIKNKNFYSNNRSTTYLSKSYT